MSRNLKSSTEVPNIVLADRLNHLAVCVARQGAHPERFKSEFTMRIPCELDRDADVVLSEAARRIIKSKEGLEYTLRSATDVDGSYIATLYDWHAPINPNDTILINNKRYYVEDVTHDASQRKTYLDVTLLMHKPNEPQSTP